MPTCVAARPIPSASVISRSIRSTRLRSRWPTSATGGAVMSSATSGYCRICASASCRRASRSGSMFSSSMTCPSTSMLRHTSVVDPREAKEILSQGAIRPETPREREERRIVEADLATSPVKGRPLPERPRTFRPDPDAAVRALGGPTLWMRRLRAIGIAFDEHVQQLDAVWRDTDPGDWPRVARAWDFSEIDDLIDRHNRHFPAEARLPMDPP